MSLAAVLMGGASLLALPAAAQVSLQFHWGDDDYHLVDPRHPLRGRQYQTMGSLAHYLDETAQDLNEQVYRAARNGDRTQRRILANVSDFARRTRDFHGRMDSYLDSPWDIRRDVNDLTQRARDLSRRVGGVRMYSATAELWNDTVEVLNLMQQVLRGQDVQVPTPHEHRAGRSPTYVSPWEQGRNDNDIHDHDHDHGVLPPPQPPRNQGFIVPEQRGVSLSGTSLQELRRLSQELDDRSSRARDTAGQTGNRDERFLQSIDHFSGEARRLRQRLDAEAIDPRDLRDTITHLRDDARRTNADMRQANVYPSVWVDWGRVVEVLERMLQIF